MKKYIVIFREKKVTVKQIF